MTSTADPTAAARFWVQPAQPDLPALRQHALALLDTPAGAQEVSAVHDTNNFQPISALNDKGQWFALLIGGVDAVDLERGLCLSTTSGRTRNARRWFVHRVDLTTGRRLWDLGKVTFRAWTLSEALERLDEPRISKRVSRLAAIPVQQPPVAPAFAVGQRVAFLGTVGTVTALVPSRTVGGEMKYRCKWHEAALNAEREANFFADELSGVEG